MQAHQPLLRMATLFYPQIFNLLRGLFTHAAWGVSGPGRKYPAPRQFSIRTLKPASRRNEIPDCGEKCWRPSISQLSSMSQRGYRWRWYRASLHDFRSQREALRFLHRVQVGLAEKCSTQNRWRQEDHHRLEIALTLRDGSVHHRLG